jgi:SpoIID/LytB domain protein
VTTCRWARALGLPALLVLVTLGVVGAAPAAGAGVARHEVYPVPPSGTYTFHGHGFGHGHGMSQWGAYGAAKVAHLSTNQILNFYYPSTTLGTRTTGRLIRVLLSAADASGRGYLQLNPAAGLSVTPFDGATTVLPTANTDGKPVTGWRLAKAGAQVRLLEHAAGAWTAVSTLGSGAIVTDTAAQLPVVEPSGVVSYRGTLTAEVESGALEAVNTVNIELYLRSVVPAEMPSSWTAAALQSQAVAARTYAWHALRYPKASWYDIDGDTRDQAYGGVGVETDRTTNAIAATAGEVIVDGSGSVVLAQYSASDGGWTVSGGTGYLPAHADPYDGMVPNPGHTWTRSVPATQIAAAFPAIGTLTGLVVTGRDNDGAWGGRVNTLTLTGTKRDVLVTGTALQAALGLPSSWFRPTPTPAAPTALKVSVSGSTLRMSWSAPGPVSGAARVSGYRVMLGPGTRRSMLPAATSAAVLTNVGQGGHLVQVVALSAAGAGPPATTTVTVG